MFQPHVLISYAMPQPALNNQVSAPPDHSRLCLCAQHNCSAAMRSFVHAFHTPDKRAKMKPSKRS